MPARRPWLALLLGVLSLAGLGVVSQYNFLVFHCLTEAFSIVIAIAVFAIFWNTRQFHEHDFFLVLGFGCLFAGVLDVIYIFAHKGMSVFPGDYGNVALQAKTAAQWFVSLSCVVAVPFLRRRVNQRLLLLVYSVLLAVALATIFLWRVFPDCYREGAGQTLFERLGLIISCTAYLAAFLLLIRRRREFDDYVLKLLAATLITFFIEDFASALATDIDGPAKIVAHLCQVVALFFVYKAFVEVGLTKPYGLLLRSQQQKIEERTAELSKTIQELHEEIVARRTAQGELREAEEQLQRHQTELAHVARVSMMGEMAASLAHELNQPLHAVTNYAYGSICRLQRKPEKDAEVMLALEQIEAEANRAAEIIRRVKEFVQKREHRASEVRLNKLVEEVVHLTKAEIEQRHAMVVLELAEDLPPVMADPIQIEQVIMNLVRNGVEAMDETPVDNRVLVIRSMPDGDEAIRIEVRDRGKGIGVENMDKIFEPFFTTKPEGMGMGLAISRSIVQAHKGCLGASVNQAQGCTFHFTLPVGTRN